MHIRWDVVLQGILYTLMLANADRNMHSNYLHCMVWDVAEYCAVVQKVQISELHADGEHSAICWWWDIM